MSKSNSSQGLQEYVVKLNQFVAPHGQPIDFGEQWTKTGPPWDEMGSPGAEMDSGQK